MTAYQINPGHYRGIVYCIHWYDLHLYYRVQNQVSGVISIMKDNLSKVIDRGEKLEDLEEKSG